MSIQEQRRKVFEVWCDGRGYGSFTTRELLWPCWEAALDSVVIELPGFACDYSYNDGIDDCREAIEAAGLKVKP